MLEIQASGERCLCDFTFDFFWQHQGARLDMDRTVGGISFRKMVQALRQGETVRIQGDAGSRLGSSLGVDLLRLGGKGGAIESTGKIIVDGNAGSHMGISMLRGAIYVSGEIKQPLGNVVQVESDLTGYRKFISATEALEKGLSVLEPNRADINCLTICDGIFRDTLRARNPRDKAVRLHGDSGMSTGILMRSGRIEVLGDAGLNTSVLMQGGATQATVIGVNWKRFRSVCPSDIGYLTLSHWTRHWIRTAPEPASGGEEGKRETSSEINCLPPNRVHSSEAFPSLGSCYIPLRRFLLPSRNRILWSTTPTTTEDPP